MEGKLVPACKGWLQTKVEEKGKDEYEDSDDTMSDVSDSSSEDDVTLKDLLQQWREDDSEADDDVPLLQLVPMMKDKEKEKQKKMREATQHQKQETEETGKEVGR